LGLIPKEKTVKQKRIHYVQVECNQKFQLNEGGGITYEGAPAFLRLLFKVKEQ